MTDLERELDEQQKFFMGLYEEANQRLQEDGLLSEEETERFLREED